MISFSFTVTILILYTWPKSKIQELKKIVFEHLIHRGWKYTWVYPTPLVLPCICHISDRWSFFVLLYVSSLGWVVCYETCKTTYEYDMHFYNKCTINYHSRVFVLYDSSISRLLLSLPQTSAITSLKHETSYLPTMWILIWSNSGLNHARKS